MIAFGPRLQSWAFEACQRTYACAVASVQLNAQCNRDKESVERRLKLVCDGVDHRSTRAPEYTEVCRPNQT